MKKNKGFTLLEMLVTVTVLAILASAVVPMTRNGVRRQKEMELRRTLRELRVALDDYKAKADQNKVKAPPPENFGYPESLEILVEGVPVTGKTGKIRFLRRIPVDPMTGKAEWGLRAIGDEPTSSSWGGGNVFDVYSLALGTGSNGIPYKEW
jgi:general secretion pathway protein G